MGYNAEVCPFLTVDAALGKEFTITEWPVWRDEALKDLKAMQDTHIVCPIIAYNDEGDLINPKKYAQVLAGATAEVHFRLSHYTIAKHGDDGKVVKGEVTDTYVADIYMIRVLSSPQTSLTTPTKRKIMAKDPSMSPSPKHGRRA